MSSFRSRPVLCHVFCFLLFTAGLAPAADPPPAKVRILLMGDSTVIGSVCRGLHPKADHLEDVVRKLLTLLAESFATAAEPRIPNLESRSRLRLRSGCRGGCADAGRTSSHFLRWGNGTAGGGRSNCGTEH